MNTKCSSLTLIIAADALKVLTQWLDLTAFRASEDAARDVLKCKETSTADNLIYNRHGTREIVNCNDVVAYVEKFGLTTKILYPDELSLEGQICEMARNYNHTPRRSTVITGIQATWCSSSCSVARSASAGVLSFRCTCK